MLVTKNNFILRKAAVGGKHLTKAAITGEAKPNAFCHKMDRMRFYFGPIADGTNIFSANDGR